MIAGSHCAKRGRAFLPGNAASCSVWDRLMARLRTATRAAVATYAPLGYEDETGFHFGMEPPCPPASHDPSDPAFLQNPRPH